MEPQYDTMSLVELKQLAKTRRIKMYYTKKRHELIQLLSMPELPESFRIEKLTIVQLRQEAKDKGLRGFWTLSRDQLVGLLYPTSSNQQNQNGDNAERHHSPKSENCENVGGENVEQCGEQRG